MYIYNRDTPHKHPRINGSLGTSICWSIVFVSFIPAASLKFNLIGHLWTYTGNNAL